MSDKLEVRLFNGPSFHRNGNQIKEFASQKTVALLAYLVCDPDAHQREKLANMLWDDREAKAASRNLRVIIASLRKTVGDYLNLDSPKPLSIKPDQNLWVDIYEFSERLGDVDLSINLVRDYLHSLNAAPLLSVEDSENLQKALALYQGEFLSGLKLKDASGFDKWLTLEREKYRHLAYYAADRLVSHALTASDFQTGIEWAQRLLNFDMLNEEGHRKMMVLRYFNGQRNAAIDQYDVIEGLLEDELGVPPSPETFQLFEQIRNGELALPTRRQKLGSPKYGEPASAQPSAGQDQSEGDSDQNADPLPLTKPQSESIPHNLTASLATLIGREREVLQLTQRIYDPARRLITIAGPGGMGKTLLAEEAAWLAYGEATDGNIFPDGLFFVPLESVPSPNLVVFAIATAIGIDLTTESFENDDDGLHALIRHLADKELFLILDNFEHLMNAKRLIRDLLHHLPGITILVTSREYLGMRGEWRLALDGLVYTTRQNEGATGLNREDAGNIDNPDNPVTALLASLGDERAPVSLDDLPPALRLFENVASQVDAAFEITETNLTSAWSICALLDGMPLGIELAASLVNEASCEDVARGVAANKDVLESVMWDVPERQRNLRAVFDHSWSLLDEKNQKRLSLLGIFSGGFNRAAAKAIADVDADVLELFVAKSLLNEHVITKSEKRTDLALDKGADQGSDETRYESHTALHQYIQENLAKDNDLYQEMELRRASYFCDVFAHHPEFLASEHAASAATQIQVEVPNLRSVWQWAIQNGRFSIVDKVLSILAPYYQLRGLNREAESLFENGISLLSVALPTDDPSPTKSGADAAEVAASTPVQPSTRSSDEAIRSTCQILIELARCQHNQSKHNACIANAQRIIKLAAVLESSQVMADDLRAQAHYQWGISLTRQGNSGEAFAQIETALAQAQRANNVTVQGHSLYQMAVIEWQRGHYTLAYAYTEQAVEIYEELQYPRGIGNALTVRGILSSFQGDFETSDAAYVEALRIYRDIGDRYGEGFVTSNLGRLWAERGNFAKADEFYESSLRINQETNNLYMVSSIVLSMGRDAAWRGDFDAAERQLDEALRYKTSVEDRRGEAEALVYKSFVAHEKGQDPAALAYADTTHSLATELADISLQAYAAMCRGRALQGQGLLAEAQASYQESYTLHTKLGQSNLRLEPMVGLAHIAYLEDRYDDAFTYVESLKNHLKDGTLYGIDDPVGLLHICYLIEHHRDKAQGEKFLRQAYDLLTQRAETILQPRKRKLYLENRKSHQAVVEAYHRLG